MAATEKHFTVWLCRKELDREIRKAFDIWEEASSLTFTRVKNPAKADIKISFVRGKHVDYGDRFPLDGSSKKGGTTLAHAFFPKGRIQLQPHANKINTLKDVYSLVF